MFYNLDVPDYMLDPPPEKKEKDMHKLSDYEYWEMHMDIAGKWVPSMGEAVYIPYDDDADCWEEKWTGSITQREYAEQGLIFATANEAVAKARQDLEAVLYGEPEKTA